MVKAYYIGIIKWDDDDEVMDELEKDESVAA